MSNTSVQVKARDNANLKRIRTKRDLGTVTNTISVLAREEATRLGLIKPRDDGSGHLSAFSNGTPGSASSVN